MSDPILIKRYASRRLYNTSTSEYVTLDEMAQLIREGHDVVIQDRKTGEDLTRQYLLQIITEQESRGENVLPINVLMGLVRSYSTSAQDFLPDFLSQSYDAFTQQQDRMMQSISSGLSAPFTQAADWQRQQAEIYQSVVQAWMPKPSAQAEPEQPSEDAETELDNVKAQLAALQKKLDTL